MKHEIKHEMIFPEDRPNLAAAMRAFREFDVPAIRDGLPFQSVAPMPERVQMEKIANAVCSAYGITRSALRSRARNMKLVVPRQAFCLLARGEADASSRQIGIFLNKAPATVRHNLAAAAESYRADQNFRARIAKIKSALEK